MIGPNPFFNEMWFLTIDPFVGISIFIAKLSKRQHRWRVFEQCMWKVKKIFVFGAFHEKARDQAHGAGPTRAEREHYHGVRV